MAITSLFTAPEDILAAQQQQDLLRRQNLSQQGSQFGVFAPLYQAGLQGLDIAAQSLMPTQDVQLRKATAAQSILNKYQFEDTADPEVLSKIAKDFASAGFTKESLALSDEASKRKKAVIEEKRAEAALRKEELSQAQELQLRKELADLGPTATEDQVLAVVTKYGSPDKIMAALSAKQSREATRLQQREFQEQRLDLARMNFNFRMDLANQKNADKVEAKENKLNAALGVADNVISVADKASKQVSGFTAGMLGKPLASIGVPAAVDLEENLKTIQANLGFKELQAMRDASPTGGALGQVALKELEFLQAALTSLSNRQSPTQLKENLDKVVKHYTAWRSAVMQARQETQPSGGGATPAPGQSTAPTVSPASIPPGVVVKKKGD